MPPWPIGLLTAAHAVSGLSQDALLHDVPLSLVFAYEHAYLADKGLICQRMQTTNSSSKE